MAKKTVFTNKVGNKIRTVPQKEVDILKDAFEIVMNDYFAMVDQQIKLGRSLEMFCLKIFPWTIPIRTQEKWLKDFRRTSPVRRG